jgi:hypothetical protein
MYEIQCGGKFASCLWVWNIWIGLAIVARRSILRKSEMIMKRLDN